MYLKPESEIKKSTATNLEVRWIQHQLKITEDGCWGTKTAASIKAKRKELGWSQGDGYTCTEKFIKAIN